MALLYGFAIASATLMCTGFASAQYLSPAQDINFPASNSAANPLTFLGANSPYYSGPNVNGIDYTVPEYCTVEQVAYVSRHGSRYPDSGAYNEWVALYNKIQASGNFKAIGNLAFLHSWRPVLTNPSMQIAQESPTGWKEAYDMGYALRTRYPDLYADGTPFISWSNYYPRVIQTAQNFVRGFLGNNADTLGKIFTINAKGSPKALFDSLAPSDLCPNFKDENGGDAVTTWDASYLPSITARLNRLITGNLTLTTSDVSIFPYLCGYESQITGRLSPFCSTFTDSELEQYQYRQDLRYYYGVGPGTDLPSKMMLPFLNSLVALLAKGPGAEGIAKNGSAFDVPSIITAFLNDGQLTELTAATGVFDNEKPLSADKILRSRKYISSHFVSMRGTVAFERLNCIVKKGAAVTRPAVLPQSTSTTSQGNQTFIRITLNDAVYPVPSCKDGPGKSCLLDSYVKLVGEKLKSAGDLISRCNVTTAGSPTTLKGASFFTDLTGDWIDSVKP
ncbi:histidine phosphatase superfamily [Bisporella sp. PMI_857]|nr:histidine phosphatase superfamily [Bisporella sp. PMI_857]